MEEQFITIWKIRVTSFTFQIKSWLHLSLVIIKLKNILLMVENISSK